MNTRRLAPRCLFLFLLAGVGTGGWCGPTPRARLERVSGTVKLLRSSNWYPVSSATQYDLYAGDHIQTFEKSSATILIDGARFQLAAATCVIIPSSAGKHGTGTPNLLQKFGKALYWLVGGGDFQVGAEAAVAGAHGTKFVLEVDADGLTTLTVLEGQVDFSNDHGGVAVSASEQSTARPGQAPTRPMRTDLSGYIQWEASLENLGLGLENHYNPSEPPARLRELLKGAQAAPAPQDAAGLIHLGDLLQDTGEAVAAEAPYRQAVALAPANAQAALRLGFNLLAQARQQEAEQVFRDAAALAPNDPAPLLGGTMAIFTSSGADHVARAKALLAQALALDPNQPATHVLAGFIAMRQGDAAQARQGLSRALELDAGNYQALAYLSALQLAEGQAEPALASARRAVALAPSSGLAHESLATAEFFVGDLKTARSEADLALQINPNSGDAHLVASDICVAQGDLISGLQEAQFAVALDPQLAPAYAALGMIALSRNGLRQAEHAFTRALELSPKLISARTGMGVTYARQGKLAAALDMQKASVALDSRTASVHNNLGAIYLARGDLDQAVAEFTTAIVRQPKWGLAHANLALAYVDLNRFADAVHEGELAVRLGEDSARCHTTLARVYLEQNRDNRAWVELRRALELDDHYALAHLRIAEVYNRQGRSRDALRHQLEGLIVQPDAVVENREYARTELQAAAGGFTANLKTDSRAAAGRDSYYINLNHTTDDLGRPRTDFHETTGVFMAGRQADEEHTQACFVSGQRYAQDRPGQALAGNAPEDPDDASVAQGGEVHYLQRYSKDNRVVWTGKIGFRDSRYTEYNPDSLASDTKPAKRLELEARGPLAEVRYDRQPTPGTLLTAGLAFSGERDCDTTVLGTPGTPLTWTTYSQKLGRGAVTGYFEYERPLAGNTQLRVGGKVAAAEGNTPVWRPRVSLRRECGKGQTLVLLTRPLLRDDVSELSPVDDWALPNALSPLALGAGGFCQTYEAQYESVPANGSLWRVAGFYRTLNSFLVDLADPNWAPTQTSVVLGAPTLRGAEAEWEQWLSRDLSAGVWLRYTDSRNNEAKGLDVPYQPRGTGQASLNYLDASGLRLEASLLYIGPRYAEVANTTRLGGYETLNLLAARQFNLHTGAFLTVNDAFNRSGAFWQGYPGGGRQIQVGVRHRF